MTPFKNMALSGNFLVRIVIDVPQVSEYIDMCRSVIILSSVGVSPIYADPIPPFTPSRVDLVSAETFLAALYISILSRFFVARPSKAEYCEFPALHSRSGPCDQKTELTRYRKHSLEELMGCKL